MDTCDVVVVGGGLVGAALALALPPGLDVVVLEAAEAPRSQELPVPQGPWDERCLALNDASRRIFQRLDVWPTLKEHAAPILATQISERGRFGVTRFTAAEAGLEALGWNVPVRVIAAVLRTAAMSTRATWIDGGKVAAVDNGPDSVALRYEAAGAGRALRARLVVAADGADSAVRRLLGVALQRRDYRQCAIVSAVRIGRPHHGVAYEYFTPEGPLAVLPKAPDACSVIQTVPTHRADGLVNMSTADYLAQLQERFGGRLGRFLQLGRRAPHRLERIVGRASVSGRVAFIGNAAQSIHPVAAQGFNLGLRDAVNLGALLAGAADPGAAQVLQRFVALRRGDRRAAVAFTDLLARAFTSPLPGLRQARHWGLVGSQLAPPAHRWLLRQHLGYFGLPPGLRDGSGG
ncbi:MAG TPA: FAD-dependent monooxygenase [Nevskiaceae bacterium]